MIDETDRRPFALLLLAIWLAFWVGILIGYSARPGFAHDSWIATGGHRNADGEWCCGEGDCFVVAPVRAMLDGYHVLAHSEVVPYAEAQPSPDGQYWRCKRPDGSRRCFFAPPPNS